LLTAPPAWVDFSWWLVREERDNVTQIFVVVAGTSCPKEQERHEMSNSPCARDNGEIILAAFLWLLLLLLNSKSRVKVSVTLI
jgi:hypothetical protein